MPKWEKRVLPNSRLARHNGYILVLHEYSVAGNYYGILSLIDTLFFVGAGFDLGWSIRKTRRKAMKHLFRLPKLN